MWSSAESQQPNDSSPSDAKKKVAAQAARLSWAATGPNNPHQKQPPCSETHRSPRPLASIQRGITPLTTSFIYLALTSLPPADNKQVMVCVQHGDYQHWPTRMPLLQGNVQPTSLPPSLTPIQGAASDSARTTERRRPSPHFSPQQGDGSDSYDL